MIALFSYKDEDGAEIADYGWDLETNQIVIIPQIPVCSFSFYLDRESGLRILK